MTNTVDILRPEVAAMQARAALPNTLMGGTFAMRLAKTTYLPQMAMETQKDYSDRLAATTLLPQFSETVDDFATKPFTEPMTFSEDTPPEILDWLENTDLQGQTAAQFFQGVLRQSLVDGITFILVDHPPVPQGATKATENAMGARPYLIHVPLANLIGWRSSTVAGKHVLTQVRILECVTEDSGDFGVAEITQIRVIDPGMVRVYRQTGDKKDWVLVDDLSGPISLQEVPIVAVYTGRHGFMVALPPLEGLAYLNVQHWQSSSDQRNILHTARVPFLFGKGLDVPKEGAEQAHGANMMMTASQPDADLKYVEHGGAAIGAGRDDLKDLEEQMRQISGELVSAVAKTATEAGLDSEQSCSWLKSQVLAFEGSIAEVLRLMGSWKGITPTGTVVLFKDFEQEPIDAPTLLGLNTLQTSGNLSRKTLLRILQDAGKLPADVDIDEELQRIDDETAAGMPPPKSVPAVP